MRNFAKLAGVACAALGLGVTGANAVPVEWTIASGGNGHFYDFIEFEGAWGVTPAPTPWPYPTMGRRAI